MLYRFEDCVLDIARRELRRADTPVPVEPQVFDLIVHLVENRDRVVSRDDLRTAVWQRRIVSESALNTAINAARTAVGDTGEDQRLIRTLPRKGLRFVAAVREEGSAAVEGADALPASDMVVPEGAHTEPETTQSNVASNGQPGETLSLRGRTVVVCAALLAAFGAALLHPLWPASNVSRNTAQTSGRYFDASVVPLIDDEARRTLAGYPDRPDVKALAIVSGDMAVSDGQLNAEVAKADALRRCALRSMRQCRIYAVGTEVMWSTAALPLPAAEDIRAEPLSFPLVPDEVPLLDRQRRERIAKQHMQAADHRALAITAGGEWTVPARATRAEAVRLALERCGYRWQRRCLLLSVDGMLTTLIPKSRRVVALFLPSTETDIPPEHKQRIALVYQGADWRALARGRSGSWHATGAEESEVMAIETVLKSCARVDSDCRLYAIGNFRVAE